MNEIRRDGRTEEARFFARFQNTGVRQGPGASCWGRVLRLRDQACPMCDGKGPGSGQLAHPAPGSRGEGEVAFALLNLR